MTNWKEGSNRHRTCTSKYEGETPLAYILRKFDEKKLFHKDGEIYSMFDGRGKGHWLETPKRIGNKDPRGYYHYAFRFNGNDHTILLHRIIYAHLNGNEEIPTGLEINHINGNPSDNRIENLELVTPSENTQHALRTGLKDIQNNNTTKLTWDEVDKIRESSACGTSTKELAELHNVTKQTIQNIINHKSWKWRPVKNGQKKSS
jgi:hypothetical protein